MMTNQSISISIALLFVLFQLPAQDMRWVDMMHDPNAQFEETVAAFDAWWGDREYTKGSGFKQFQRWKHYMESRVAPDGSQSKPLNTYREFKKYYDQYLAGKAQLPGEPEWTEVGPVNLPANGTGQPNGVGRVAALTFHPTDPNTYYVGSAAGGIIKTTDYGATYTNISNNLTRLGVSSIVIHPTTPDIIYIGTGDRDGGDAPGLGVWRTLDGGLTWTAHNTNMGNRTVYEILMDPNNSDILIASTNNGIYRSTDAGVNWTLAYSGYTNKDIAFHPTNSDIVYAGGSRFFRSLDNGATWTQITNGAPNGVSRTAIAVTSAAPDYVYLFSGDSGGFNGLYKSSNSGASFTTQSTSPNICGYDVDGGTGNQSWYDLAAIGDPADADHIIIGAINIWESNDGGVTWNILSHWVGAPGAPPVHADQHVIEVSPHTGDRFHGHDGGIHYTSDNGTSYTELSDGLGISQIYRLGQSALEGDLSISGYQDNGTAIFDNGSWRTEIGGDGFESIIDYEDSNVMYGALYYGDVRRSTNRGVNFSRIAANGVNGINESGAWLTPYVLDPEDPDTMAIGYKNVWMSYDARSAASNAVTWNKISSFATTSNIIDLEIAPSDRNRMYVSRSGTLEFFRCDDIHAAVPVWIDLTAALPASGDPRDIAIHPADEDKLWIALGNNIYESTDAGLTWTDISGTLPNISLNCIVYDPRDINGAMYVGMDVGVYYKDNSLADWVPYLTDIPNTEVTDLEIYIDDECESQNKIVAATYGRGQWESPLYFDAGTAPSVCFEATSTEGCLGQTIGINDQSHYGPTSWVWTITPGTFSFVNGTNQNSENIEVTFSSLGLYTVTLEASNAAGSNILTKTNYININDVAISLPLYEDFEMQTNCNTSSNCGATVCNIMNSWINQTNGVDDDIDFRVDNGGTPSNNTGPSVDSKPGTAAGKYVYTEASNGCTGQTAKLITPCIDLVNEEYAYISFDYHMYGSDVGSLYLDVEVNGVWQEGLFSISGNQGNAWHTALLSLNDYIGNIVRLRLRGVTGPGWSSDIALDNLIIDNNICYVDDIVDGNPGALRFCIDNVNNGDLIWFMPSSLTSPLVITGTGLTVNKDVILQASPADNIHIDGSTIDRVFSINSGKTVTIEGVKITAGTAILGRAIYNEGILTIKDIEILENIAPPSGGDVLHNLGSIDIEGNNSIGK